MASAILEINLSKCIMGISICSKSESLHQYSKETAESPYAANIFDTTEKVMEDKRIYEFKLKKKKNRISGTIIDLDPMLTFISFTRNMETL